MPRNKTQGTSIPGCCLDQQLPGIAGRVATFRHLQVMMRGIRIPRLGLHQIQMIMDPPPGHRHVHAGLIDLPDPGDNMAGILPSHPGHCAQSRHTRCAFMGGVIYLRSKSAAEGAPALASASSTSSMVMGGFLNAAAA